MKKLILLFALAAMQCSEGEEISPTACYECTTVTTATGYSDTSNQKACGITPKEAEDIEKIGTGTTTQLGVTVRQRTNCRKI